MLFELDPSRTPFRISVSVRIPFLGVPNCLGESDCLEVSDRRGVMGSVSFIPPELNVLVGLRLQLMGDRGVAIVKLKDLKNRQSSHFG